MVKTLKVCMMFFKFHILSTYCEHIIEKYVSRFFFFNFSVQMSKKHKNT